MPLASARSTSPATQTVLFSTASCLPTPAFHRAMREVKFRPRPRANSYPVFVPGALKRRRRRGTITVVPVAVARVTCAH